MRTNGKLELHQQFIGRRAGGIVRAPVLETELAELAWPVRDNSRFAFVLKRGVVGMACAVIASAQEPSTRKLIVSRDVIAVPALQSAWLLTPACAGKRYFEEIGAIVNAGGPPDMTKVKTVMDKYGLIMA